MLDITEFFKGAEPAHFSASRVELGEFAGEITWNNALNTEHVLLTSDEERDDFRDYVRGFGAWSDEEIASWSDTELNALCVQFIAGDMREAGLHAAMDDDDWLTYEDGAHAGQYSGRICRLDDGRIGYDLSV